LIWLFDIVSEPWWPSGHEFKYHHPHLFNKNQTQSNMDMYKFQIQKAFTWGDVLENNINYILRLSNSLSYWIEMII
jgi:hypothetical protein